MLADGSELANAPYSDGSMEERISGVQEATCGPCPALREPGQRSPLESTANSSDEELQCTETKTELTEYGILPGVAVQVRLAQAI